MQVIVAARRTGKTTYAKMVQRQEGARCLRLVPSLGLASSENDGSLDCTTYSHYLSIIQGPSKYQGYRGLGYRREEYPASRLDPSRYDTLVCEEPSRADVAFGALVRNLDNCIPLPVIILAIGTPLGSSEFFYSWALKNRATRWTNMTFQEDMQDMMGTEVYQREYHAKFQEEL